MANNYIDISFCFVPCVYRIRRPYLHLVTLSILKPFYHVFLFPAVVEEMIFGRETVCDILLTYCAGVP